MQSKPTVFTLTNHGAVASGPVLLSMGGMSPGQFAITDMCNGATLAANGGACTVSIAFAPSQGTRGNQTATLTATATPGGTSVVNVTGTAVRPATLSLSQPPLPEWTDVGVGQSGGDVTFTVANIGDVPSGPITEAIPGTGPNDPYIEDFFVDAEKFPCGQPLDPGAQCSFPIRFYASTANATQTETMTVTASPGGTASATLEGTGLWVLTVQVDANGCASGSATGTVSGLGMDCSSSFDATGAFISAYCTQTYTDGAMVNLTYTAGPSAFFSGWSGACTTIPTNGPSPCTLTMTQNQAVNATFCAQIP
jgi:hypothetical protein